MMEWLKRLFTGPKTITREQLDLLPRITFAPGCIRFEFQYCDWTVSATRLGLRIKQDNPKRPGAVPNYFYEQHRQYPTKRRPYQLNGYCTLLLDPLPIGELGCKVTVLLTEPERMRLTWTIRA